MASSQARSCSSFAPKEAKPCLLLRRSPGISASWSTTEEQQKSQLPSRLQRSKKPRVALANKGDYNAVTGRKSTSPFLWLHRGTHSSQVVWGSWAMNFRLPTAKTPCHLLGGATFCSTHLPSCLPPWGTVEASPAGHAAWLHQAFQLTLQRQRSSVELLCTTASLIWHRSNAPGKGSMSGTC